MATTGELQKQHEARISLLVAELAGKDKESDWALVRALVHRGIHLAADGQAGEFCAVATLLAEMAGHAHQVMHGGERAAPHADVVH